MSLKPLGNIKKMNICAGVLRCTPSSEVMWSEQSCDLFLNKMVEHYLHCTEISFLSFHSFIFKESLF